MADETESTIYERGGLTRVAVTPEDHVQLRFAGWRPQDEVAAAAAQAAEDADDEVVPTPPPLAGAGSSTAAWVAYASAVGVDVTEDAKREDIVTAIRDAGHPVEADSEVSA